jgi:hypothetical protein
MLLHLVYHSFLVCHLHYRFYQVREVDANDDDVQLNYPHI